MFNTICTNMLKCHNGTKYCTGITSKHTKHAKTSCTKPATHGPKGTKKRDYCKECMNQLHKFEELVDTDYEKTNNKCIVEQCLIDDSKKVIYGYRGQSPTHCKTHAESDIQVINLKSGTPCDMLDDHNQYCCKVKGTQIVGTKYYCSDHANIISQQLNIEIVSTKPKCIETNCNELAGYILDSNIESTKATHCNKCAKATKVPFHSNKKRKNCETCATKEIEKRATFGLIKGKPLYCDKCAENKGSDYWDVLNKQCITCETKVPIVHTRAYFHNGTTLDYCFDCNPNKQKILDERAELAKSNPKSPKDKKPSAKNKFNHSRTNWADYCPKCPEETASAKMYGWSEDGRKMFCKAHKEDGMINVISNRCDFDLGPDETEEKGNTVSDSNGALLEPRLCNKIAQYGIKKAHRCADHKENLNRLVNACNHDNCNERRTHGIRNRETGKGKIQFCADHKQDDMIDISHRLCQHLNNDQYNCDYRAAFPEVQDGPEMYCASHNINNHHDVTHKKCSEEIEGVRCHIRAAYGYVGKGNGHRGTPEKCFDHRGDRINVVVDRCIRCHFGTQHQVKANQAKRKHMCSTCYRETSDPDALEKFNKKEIAIRTSIQKHSLIKSIPNVDQLIIYDKAVGSGCRSRPDILIKLSTHNVIVEIDEHQHNRECYSDDDARIIEIHYALESKPLIVIRFNPDSYKTESGVKNGLFNKSTGAIIRLTPYDDAIDELVSTIYTAINSIPVTFIKTLYLRYTPDDIKKKP